MSVDLDMADKTTKPQTSAPDADQLVSDVGSLGSAYIAVVLNRFNGHVSNVTHQLVEDAGIVRFEQLEGRKLGELLSSVNVTMNDIAEFEKALRELEVGLTPV